MRQVEQMLQEVPPVLCSVVVQLMHQGQMPCFVAELQARLNRRVSGHMDRHYQVSDYHAGEGFALASLAGSGRRGPGRSALDTEALPERVNSIVEGLAVALASNLLHMTAQADGPVAAREVVLRHPVHSHMLVCRT